MNHVNYVTVGLSVDLSDQVLPKTRFNTVWAALESHGVISKDQAIAMVSTNVETLLGIARQTEDVELVVTHGGELMEYGKVVALLSPVRGAVDLLQL